MLRIPVYVSADMEKALSEPEASTMHVFGRLGMVLKNVLRSTGEAGTAEEEQQKEQSERLASITYEDLLRDRLVYGTPEMGDGAAGRGPGCAGPFRSGDRAECGRPHTPGAGR